MVLPVRIELTTSALPRMRSTTELRQRPISLMLGDLAQKPEGLKAAGRAGQGRAIGRGAGACQAGGWRRTRPAMTKPPASTAREERLAEQLRANLRRRKAQARALAPDPSDPLAAPDPLVGPDELAQGEPPR